ncbi:ECF RNA polymerase sigma factor SigK [Flexivirga oryzae]|uniref:RNA polymerase sigma-70 factor (ECF subfamily) n=1 Tax=Flexivirga oryzae TaxID=1794944 RepID=A0A839N1I3_9MICO|nr:RNA polymerase sigma-70 factor (ECF subfamily) [Flexivirga oryzae]
MHAVPDDPAQPDGQPGDELAAILAQCARGDEGQFARLYDATAARIFGLVRRIVRDPTQSEEVTQEVYLQIWRQCARFDPSAGSAVGWMMTIAHRRAVDRVRSAQARTERETAYDARQQTVPYDTTAENAHRELDAERVRKALGNLTPTQRSAIDLAYFGGYTHREVAALLNLPMGTAKTRIRDGLIRLRDTMGVEQ